MRLPSRLFSDWSQSDGLRSPRWVAGCLLSVAIDLLLFSNIFGRPPGDNQHLPPTALVLAVAAVGFGLLLVRDRAPRTAMVLLCVHSAVASLWLNFDPTVEVLVAAVTAVARRGLRPVFIPLGLAGATTATWTVSEARGSSTWTPTASVVVETAYLAAISVAAGVGYWRWTVRRDAEHIRRAAEREAVIQERRRIAWELHDNVAHAVTVMALQAAGARRMMTQELDVADEALAVVDRTAAEAMAELRHMLSVLQAEDGAPVDSAQERPRHLTELADLLVRMRLVGLTVDCRTEGAAVPLDPSVETAAMCVLQEALTNIGKHVGAGAYCRIVLRWQPRQLRIEVTDDGSGAGSHAALSTGHGLAALSERVSLAGGTLEARPTPPRPGFAVTALLPTS